MSSRHLLATGLVLVLLAAGCLSDYRPRRPYCVVPEETLPALEARLVQGEDASPWESPVFRRELGPPHTTLSDAAPEDGPATRGRLVLDVNATVEARVRDRELCTIDSVNWGGKAFVPEPDQVDARGIPTDPEWAFREMGGYGSQGKLNESLRLRVVEPFAMTFGAYLYSRVANEQLDLKATPLVVVVDAFWEVNGTVSPGAPTGARYDDYVIPLTQFPRHILVETAYAGTWVPGTASDLDVAVGDLVGPTTCAGEDTTEPAAVGPDQARHEVDHVKFPGDSRLRNFTVRIGNVADLCPGLYAYPSPTAVPYTARITVLSEVERPPR